MARKKTKAEKIAAISIEEIGKLSGESGRKKLEGYVKSLRLGYKRRILSFRNKRIFSYAQESLERSFPKGYKQKPVGKMTRNQLLMEFARYQKFFNDKTSTIEGIKEEHRKQDERIFGTDKKGKAKNTMSASERVKFWSAYNEYVNQRKGILAWFPSEELQQLLADAMFTDGISPDDINNLWARVDELIQQAQNRESEQADFEEGPNVYSGRGPFRSR